jgi:hypothetical protein
MLPITRSTMTTVFAQQFVGQPLILKTTYEGAEKDHAIHFAGHLVGRIMPTPMSGGVESWLWTVTGPCIPPELRPARDERTRWLTQRGHSGRNSMLGWHGRLSRLGRCRGMARGSKRGSAAAAVPICQCSRNSSPSIAAALRGCRENRAEARSSVPRHLGGQFHRGSGRERIPVCQRRSKNQPFAGAKTGQAGKRSSFNIFWVSWSN